MAIKNIMLPRPHFKGIICGEKWYGCPQCDYSFEIRELVKMVGDGTENTYCCPNCSAKFFL